ncbi:hypothetical protein ACGF5C_18950 [Micromonospora sp. NPDC047620]|uniref:hypothetical protein n=1 Tax=Micromonospora sp. NPDC047620 TaxID=3364251 RepID=UPI00371F4016
MIQLVDADDAASICVHGRGADCRISSYWLRFGQYLVQMAITNQGSGASHADFRKDEMLVAVARHLRGKLES